MHSCECQEVSLLRLEILVTTQPTQPENNDTHVSVVEESSASQSGSLQGTNGEPFESQPANALRATASQSGSLQGTNGEPFESQPANALRATASQSGSL